MLWWDILWRAVVAIAVSLVIGKWVAGMREHNNRVQHTDKELERMIDDLLGKADKIEKRKKGGN